MIEPDFVTWTHGGKEYRQVSNQYKLALLEHYQAMYKFNTFVETGTYKGDTLGHMLNFGFEKLYSIELNSDYYHGAVRRFEKETAVTILQGDSELVLPRVLSRIDSPTLFWLDAHGDDWIGPVVSELQTIFNQFHHRAVVLIDDMDYMPDKLPEDKLWKTSLIDGIARCVRVLP